MINWFRTARKEMPI